MNIQQQQGEYYNPYMQPTQDIFSKWIFDSQEALDRIKHHLRGEEEVEIPRDIEGQSIIVKEWMQRTDAKGHILPPPVNQEGYNFTMGILTPLMDKIISASNLDKEKASDLALENINNITITYYENYTPKNLFGFQSEAEMNAIIGWLLTVIYAQLLRAVNMETLKQVNSSTQIVENRNIDKRPQQMMPGIGM